MEPLPRLQSLPERIRFLRKDRLGLSQEKLAGALQASGVADSSFSSIRRYEAGKVAPRTEFVYALADLADVPRGWLADEAWVPRTSPEKAARPGQHPGWLADLVMDAEMEGGGGRAWGERFVEVARARGVWTDLDDVSWRTFTRTQPRHEAPGDRFEALQDAPTDAIKAIAVYEDELGRLKQADESNPVSAAFAHADAWVQKGRATGEMRDAGYHYWLAFREGAIRAGAYSPGGDDRPVSQRLTDVI